MRHYCHVFCISNENYECIIIAGLHNFEQIKLLHGLYFASTFWVIFKIVGTWKIFLFLVWISLNMIWYVKFLNRRTVMVQWLRPWTLDQEVLGSNPFAAAVVPLKEKLPQAFMHIGWMEDDFRNLTAKVWANLDNPIKRYHFLKVSLILCMSPSQVALF